MESYSGGVINADVDSSEDIAIIDTKSYDRLYISFLVGTASLSAFTVEYSNWGDNYSTVASSAGNYTTPNAPVLGASGSLVTAAFGSTVHWLKLDVGGVGKVRIKAAGTSSTITGQYTLYHA